MLIMMIHKETGATENGLQAKSFTSAILLVIHHQQKRTNYHCNLDLETKKKKTDLV